MNRRLYLLFLPVLLVALAVAMACGGDDDDPGGSSPSTSSSGSGDTNSNDNNRDDEDDEDDVFGGSGNNEEMRKRIEAIDLCPMLTDVEAAEVSNARGLGGSGVTATYTVSREKDEYTDEQQSIRPRSGCKWIIQAANAGQVAIQITVQEADGYETLYKPGGKPIDDLGDDAVDNAGTVYVKVGDLMLTPGENSATTEYATEILRKIVPDLD